MQRYDEYQTYSIYFIEPIVALIGPTACPNMLIVFETLPIVW